MHLIQSILAIRPAIRPNSFRPFSGWALGTMGAHCAGQQMGVISLKCKWFASSKESPVKSPGKNNRRLALVLGFWHSALAVRKTAMNGIQKNCQLKNRIFCYLDPVFRRIVFNASLPAESAFQSVYWCWRIAKNSRNCYVVVMRRLSVAYGQSTVYWVDCISNTVY